MHRRIRRLIFTLFLAIICFPLFTLSRATASPQPIVDDAAPPIYLRNGMITPAAGVDVALQQAAPQQAVNGRLHVLLQLDQIPTPAGRAQLAARGIKLLHYVPQQAWIASIPANALTTLTAQTAVRWIGPWHGSDKLSPRLQGDDFPDWIVHEDGRLQLLMMLHADVPLAEGVAIAEAHDAIIAGQTETPPTLTVWITPQRLDELAAADGVLWLEEAPPPLSSLNDGGRSALNVPPVSAAGLDGSGVNLFIFDAGTVGNHAALDSRVTTIDDAPAISHATHVAGTAAGDGSVGPNGRNLQGIAPGATIISAGLQKYSTPFFWDNIGDIEEDYALARTDYDVDLSSNSIGSNTAYNGFDCDLEGDYGVASALLDGVVRGDHAALSDGIIVSWAGGNERTGANGRCGSNFYTTAPPACAKNPIHVGATNSDGSAMTHFSSWGPCDDGRLKPIITGPGCESGLVTGESGIRSTLPGGGYGNMCGTSMAAPAVAGVMALAVEQYRLTVGDDGARPGNALMKAWLMHTADDQGAAGPDYAYGYGQVDATAVIDLVKTPTDYHTAAITVQQQVDETPITVPAGAGELKVSLAWDDKAASAFTSVALVNDLDLTLIAPDGSEHFPFSLDAADPVAPATATGPNTVDNQEQIIVTEPQPGTWTIRVRGTAVPAPSQPYALVHTVSQNAVTCGSDLIINGEFDVGGRGWIFDTDQPAATVVTAPGGGSGTALHLGGESGTAVQEYAYQRVTIPETAVRATLSFDWYMTSQESEPDYAWDTFQAMIMDADLTPLAVVDLRSNGWPRYSWQTNSTIDLSAYTGQTIAVRFQSILDPYFATDFYVDNVSLVACEPAASADGLAVMNQGMDTAASGQMLTYRLAVTNHGATPATGVVLTDTLPLHTTLIPESLSGDAIQNGANGIITWGLDSELAPGETMERQLSVRVADGLDAGTQLVNAAVVSADNAAGHSATAVTLIDVITDLFLPLVQRE